MPDYTGNGAFEAAGNILETGLATLIIPDYAAQLAVRVSGSARILEMSELSPSLIRRCVGAERVLALSVQHVELQTGNWSPALRCENAPPSGPLSHIETPEQIAQRNNRRQMADMALSVLPDKDGMTLQDVQRILQHWQYVNPQQIRPSVLLESLRHLQHAGLVASTANQAGDDLASRRYWRVPTSGK
ncbi:MAG: hypothetical protein ABI406_16840 [Ktedonobacteraceae bacterium]